MKYSDPIVAANETASFLKKKKKCSIVICLSHLGLEKSGEVMGDVKLVRNTSNIDVVIGGHSHNLLLAPHYEQNINGKKIPITQMGKNGIYVGRLDVFLK